jgi:hypothetical protein
MATPYIVRAHRLVGCNLKFFWVLEGIQQVE